MIEQEALKSSDNSTETQSYNAPGGMVP